MTSFAADSTASAVILFDGGEVYHDGSGNLILDRHVRIKILNEEGIERADIDIVYRAETRTANVYRIRGETYNLDDRGRFVTASLNRREIFEEDLGDDLKRVRFTLPQVRVGSVIEYRYRQRFDYAYWLPSWTFQSDEPVRHAQLVVRMPNRFRYVIGSRGFINLNRNYTTRPITGPLGDTVEHTWVLTDLPALREEPYMTTPRDYMSRISFQPSGYIDGYGVLRPFINTWERLAEDLYRHDNFGRQFGRHREIRNLAAVLTEQHEDDASKLEAIHSHVRNNIDWNGRIGYYIPDRRLTDVLRTTSGTASEINLLLLALLKDAGLQADPVLISTRDHGATQEVYPLLGQFNTIIVAVEIDGRRQLVDATSNVRDTSLLPLRALNQRGWLVSEAKPTWISIQPNGKYRRQVVIEASLDEKGTLEADMTIIDREYAAVMSRAGLRDESQEDHFKDAVLGDLREPEIVSHSVEGQFDLTQPLVQRATFRIPDFAMVAGDMVYVNGQILERTDSNPLRLPDRSFPVDMGYETDVSYSLSLKLPEGYELADSPKDVAAFIPGRAAIFQRVSQAFGSTLSVQSRFNVNNPIMQPDVYPHLRELFSTMVAASNDQFVFRRADIHDAVQADVTEAGEGK